MHCSCFDTFENNKKLETILSDSIIWWFFNPCQIQKCEVFNLTANDDDEKKVTTQCLSCIWVDSDCQEQKLMIFSKLLPASSKRKKNWNANLDKISLCLCFYVSSLCINSWKLLTWKIQRYQKSLQIFVSINFTEQREKEQKRKEKTKQKWQ